MDDEKNDKDKVKEKTKQGKTDKITKDVSDFKGGVQKTKSCITCEDVLKDRRARGEEE
jgi:hypothetical protein